MTNVNQEVAERPKQNIIVRFWNKTIFPQMIKDKRERKQWEREIRRQAMEEAKDDIATAMKEKIKKEEIDKITEPKKSFGEKFAKGMETVAKGFGADPNQPKKEMDIAGMMGMGNSNNNTNNSIGFGSSPNVDVVGMLGTGKRKKDTTGLGTTPTVDVEKILGTSKKKKSKKRKTKKKKMDQEPEVESFEDKMKRMLS